MKDEKISEAILNAFNSPDKMDLNPENANVVDGLFAISRALQEVAKVIANIRDRMPLLED